MEADRLMTGVVLRKDSGFSILENDGKAPDTGRRQSPAGEGTALGRRDTVLPRSEGKNEGRGRGGGGKLEGMEGRLTRWAGLGLKGSE